MATTKNILSILRSTISTVNVRTRRLSRRKKIILFILLSIVFAIIIHAAYLAAQDVPTTPTAINSGTTDPTSTDNKLKREDPTFKALLPSKKSAASLGGWYRVSPAGTDAVNAFVDRIGTVQVIVSEQPLPKPFINDAERQVAQLATNYNAQKKLTVGATTAYIGTSESGPQSVIFTKAGLLILIKSSAHLENNDWSDYINALEN